jgi:DNA-directed RNA polymerase specialized sigma24 family protein
MHAPLETEARRVLVDALSAMPRKQREAMVLHYLAGVPRLDIASALRLPPGRVDAMLAAGEVAIACGLLEVEVAPA